jgi:hypothetical protein
LSPTSRSLLAGAAALGLAIVAAVVTAHSLRGPAKRFEQRAVPAGVVRAIEATTAELVGLDGEQRRLRLRQAMVPDAPPEALESLAAQLEAMKRAASWKLAAADGYGPVVIKAIYDLTDGEGHTHQIALIFKQRDGQVALLDVAR